MTEEKNGYVELPEGPAPPVPGSVEELFGEQMGTVYEPPRRVKDLSQGRRKIFRVQFCVVALVQILLMFAFFTALLVPSELFYIRAGSAFLTFLLLQAVGFLAYTAIRKNFILQEQVYGPLDAMPGVYLPGVPVPPAQGSNLDELVAKQLEREENARIEWKNQEGEMKKRLDACFADFCGGVKGFDRKKSGKCVGCRYKMDCMMATQQRVMQKIYKEHRRGDDWQNED